MTENKDKKSAIFKKVAIDTLSQPPFWWGVANFFYGLAASAIVATIGAFTLLAIGTLNTGYKVFRNIKPAKPDQKNPVIRFLDKTATNPSFYLLFSGMTLGVYSANYAVNAIDASRMPPEAVITEAPKMRAQIIRNNALMSFGTGCMMSGNVLMALQLIAAQRRREK